MDELIKHFNNTVCDMKISQQDKMTLFGLITAIGFKYQQDMPKWIPVTERLPEDYEPVLTCDDHENIHIMTHTKIYKYPFGISPMHPRYFMPKWWMPLPEPPESEGE